jgi:hypothetical protein
MFNIEVFYTVPDMGYWCKLLTCIECGELFVLDMENPNVAGKEIAQIAGDELCPQCGKQLRESIRTYPDVFHTDDGRIGHFEPDRIVPPDSESVVKKFFELGV